MITRIPEGQICQAFDPRMILTEEALRMHNTTEQPNTSCLATAYVYVEGKHGKKFLCDSHYYYEIYMNRQCYSAPNSSWKDFQQFLINETEKVKETFAKNVKTTETLGHQCSLNNYFNPGGTGCTADALVKVNPTSIPAGKINFTTTVDINDFSKDIFYCNFHFRRTINRYLSNGLLFQDYHKVVDERHRMTMTLDEEAARLTYV
jgi:hypothetical protein